MDILDKFPLSKKEFFGWFMNSYGLTEKIFNQASFDHQCESISRFLGYITEFPQSWGIIQIEEHINKILYIYEKVTEKYPDGCLDPIKSIMKMDHNERINKYPEMFKQAELIRSFTEAIIPIEKYNFKFKPLLSLKDAIIQLENISSSIPYDYQFWQDIINSTEYEKPPF
jgi:hypothetical protein